ncbi:unnamed protein product, partial [Choristocarpus tenellus]
QVKEIETLRLHVKRRTQALGAMRKAYITDVNNLKRELLDKVTIHASLTNMDNINNIPSLDFRPILRLYAPTDTHFQVTPCSECGGTMEVGAVSITQK